MLVAKVATRFFVAADPNDTTHEDTSSPPSKE
jgi:hypothetical protein